MTSLKINTGDISLEILGDDDKPRGVFKFNPEDIVTTKKFLQVQKDFALMEKEYQDRAAMTEDTLEVASLLAEIVTFLKTKLDEVYGENTSKVLFGDACTLSMFSDFFDGIEPYYTKAINKMRKKYSKNGK